MKTNKQSSNLKQKTRINLFVIIILALLFCGSIFAVTFAWFTDSANVEVSDTINFGTIKISADGGAEDKSLLINLQRELGGLSDEIMPGDTISCSVSVKNIGTNDCYYLVCFSTDNEIISSVFCADYYYNSSSSKTAVSLTNNKDLGSLTVSETQTITLSLKIDEELNYGQNSETNIKCSVYAIQKEHITLAEAWTELQTLKKQDGNVSSTITLLDEMGGGITNSSLTKNVKVAYTDSTKTQFYLDASNLSTDLENSSGESLYFFSTESYSSTAYASKYIATNASNSKVKLMNNALTSKTSTGENSYLAALAYAQNYDVTYDLSNKIVYDVPLGNVNLYPVFLKANYGNTDTTKNTYTKGETEYLILSRDKTTTKMAEFNSHTNIKAVVIPNTIETITEGTFVNCSNLEYVVWPTSNLKTLGYQCFSRINVKNLILPDCIENLNNQTSYGGAFSFTTTIEYVKLPANLKNSLAAFYQDTGLKAVDCANAKMLDVTTFRNCSSLATIDFGDVQTIGQQALQGCTNLTNIDLKNVQTIGTMSFYNCTNLKSIDFGNIQTIGIQAFQNCTSLTSINLPASLQSLNTLVFMDSGLTGEVGIPYQCEISGTSNGPFVQTVGITGFYLKDENGNRIKQTTFTRNSKTITYIEEDGVIYKSLENNKLRIEAFPNGKVANEFYIGENVTQIRRFELENAKYIKKIGVDENNEFFENDSYGVIYMKKETTYDGWTFTKNMLYMPTCGADLTSYTVRENTTGIYLFCIDKLEHLIIPSTCPLTKISGWCFPGSENLKTINSSVDGVYDLSAFNITEIPYGAFYKCYSLKEIILPATCTTIGNGAFMYSGLTKLTTYATTKLTLSKTYNYASSGDLLKYTGRYVENGTEKYHGLQEIYVLNSDLIASYQADSEWNVYLSKSDGEDYKLNIYTIS